MSESHLSADQTYKLLCAEREAQIALWVNDPASYAAWYATLTPEERAIVERIEEEQA